MVSQCERSVPRTEADDPSLQSSAMVSSNSAVLNIGTRATRPLRPTWRRARRS